MSERVDEHSEDEDNVLVELTDLVFMLAELEGSRIVSEEFMQDDEQWQAIVDLELDEQFLADLERIKYILERYSVHIDGEELDE